MQRIDRVWRALRVMPRPPLSVRRAAWASWWLWWDLRMEMNRWSVRRIDAETRRELFRSGGEIQRLFDFRIYQPEELEARS